MIILKKDQSPALVLAIGWLADNSKALFFLSF